MIKLLKNKYVLVKSKIRKFIYSYIDKLRLYHKKILVIKEKDLEEKFDLNLYQIFYDWLIDVLQYGTLISISLLIFGIGIKQFLFWIVPLGILRWLMLDTLKMIKKELI
jgi:hypothetical protein